MDYKLDDSGPGCLPYIGLFILDLILIGLLYVIVRNLLRMTGVWP